jgi:hypothetical protein
LAVNKVWHQAHRMPKNASLEQRIRWHAAHANHCACRPVPKTVLAEMRKMRRALAHPHLV